jgi:hypothetical protein
MAGNASTILGLRKIFLSCGRFLIVVLLASAITLPWLFSAQQTQASGAIPTVINFQGKITNVSGGSNVADGSYAIQFKIYTALTSGTLLWTETFDQASGACAKLALVSGVFSAPLGSCNAFNFDFTTGSLYLTVNFNPGTGYDGEMSPRLALNSVPYAFNANNLAGNGRIDLAYAPSTTTYGGAAINYSPTVSAANSVLALTAGSNVTGPALNVIQGGTGGAILIGSTALAGATQTYLGANPASFSGNFVDLQINGSSEFKVSSSGALTLGTALSVGNGGTGNTSYSATNGVVYYDGTKLTSTAASTAAQCLQTASSGSAPIWGSCGGGGSTWNGISTPTGNLSLTMNSYTSTFTYGATTGSANLFNLTDTASNNGTGILLNVTTATGSTLQPFNVSAKGTSALSVNASGLVTANNFGSSNAAITGGSINSTPIGGTSNSTGAFTTLSALTPTNSTTAFQVQNSLAAPIFSVDTTTTNYITNPGFEVNNTGWSLDGATSDNRVTTNKYLGVASMAVATPATANTGVKTASFNTALTSTTQYTLSFYAQALGSNFTTLQAGWSNTGSGETTCLLNSTSVVTTGWRHYYCTFSTLTVSGSPYIFIEQSDNVSRTFYIDSVQLQTGAVATPYYIGAEQLRGVVNAPVSFASTTNSNTAFQIQDSTGTENLFVADTLDNEVGIGTASPTQTLSVQGTANVLTPTNSTTAFQVQNSQGIPIFVVDTTSTNYLTNPGFEVNTSGWSLDGATSITRVTTNRYAGVGSLQILNPATANTGAETSSFSTALASTIQYTLSFYAQASGSNFTTLKAGWSNTGSGETTCSLNSTSVVTTGWNHYYCTFTTGSVSGTPYIFIEQSDATSRTFFIDAVQLQTGATVTPYYIGAEQLRGIVNSPATFESTTNSTTAFQIQDSTATENLFVADTLDSRIGIGTASPTAELSVSSAAASGTSINTESVALPTDINLNTATKVGIALTMPIYTQATAATSLVDGLNLLSPGATSTTTAAGTLNWNGLDITTPVETANFTGSTINQNGLQITVGNLTQTAGTANSNGITLNMASTTITTGGTLNGLVITPPTTAPSVGTVNAINIGTSTSSTANTFDGSTISVGNIASTAQQNLSTLTLQNGGTGNFDLELVRGFINYESENTLYDDFTGAKLDTNKWAATVIASGACPSAPTTTGLNGYLTIATGTTAGKGCAISTQATPANGYFQRGDNPVYETRIQTATAGSGVRIFAGFTSAIVGANTDVLTSNHAWIEKTAAGTQFTCDTANGTTESTGNTFGPTIVANTWYRLRVEMTNGTTPEVVCTVDTGAVGGISRVAITADVPAATTAEDVYTAAETSDATSENVLVDYIRAWQDDPQTDSGAQTGLAPVISAPAPVDFTLSGVTASTYAQAAVDTFFSQAALVPSNGTVDQLYAGRLTAGLEILTPKLIASGLSVDSIGALHDVIALTSDMQFIGRPYFNSDTAGFAEIKQGAQSVNITFASPYLTQPVIAANLTNDADPSAKTITDSAQLQVLEDIQQQQAQAMFSSNIQFAVINKNENGFTIYLNKPATQNLEFSWIALAVLNAQTFSSSGPAVVQQQENTPVIIENSSDQNTSDSSNVSSTDSSSIDSSTTDTSTTDTSTSTSTDASTSTVSTDASTAADSTSASTNSSSAASSSTSNSVSASSDNSGNSIAASDSSSGSTTNSGTTSSSPTDASSAGQ